MKKTLDQEVKSRFESWSTHVMRDPVSHRPIGMVALGRTLEGIQCRGVTICSATEKFNEFKGRAKAIGRMIKVAKRGASFALRPTWQPLAILPIKRTADVNAYLGMFDEKTGRQLHPPRKDRGFTRAFSVARFLQRVYPYRYKAYYGTRFNKMELKALATYKPH